MPLTLAQRLKHTRTRKKENNRKKAQDKTADQTRDSASRQKSADPKSVTSVSKAKKTSIVDVTKLSRLLNNQADSAVSDFSQFIDTLDSDGLNDLQQRLTSDNQGRDDFNNLVNTEITRRAANSLTTDVLATTKTAQSINEVTSTLALPPSQLSAAQLSEAITNIDAAIAKGQVLLPENAGFFARLLQKLKKALMDLGGVDPKLQIKDRAQLEAIITEKRTSTNTDPQKQRAVSNALSDLALASTALDKDTSKAADSSSPKSTSPDSSSPDGASSVIQNVQNKLDQLLKQTTKPPVQMTASDLERSLKTTNEAITSAKTLDANAAAPVLKTLYQLQKALTVLNDLTEQGQNGDAQQQQELTQALLGLESALQKLSKGLNTDDSADTSSKLLPVLDVLAQKSSSQPFTANELSQALVQLRTEISLTTLDSERLRQLHQLRSAILALAGLASDRQFTESTDIEPVLTQAMANHQPDAISRQSFTKAVNALLQD